MVTSPKFPKKQAASAAWIPEISASREARIAPKLAKARSPKPHIGEIGDRSSGVFSRFNSCGTPSWPLLIYRYTIYIYIYIHWCTIYIILYVILYGYIEHKNTIIVIIIVNISNNVYVCIYIHIQNAYIYILWINICMDEYIHIYKLYIYIYGIYSFA